MNRVQTHKVQLWLAVMYMFVQFMVVLWLPEALAVHRILTVTAPLVAAGFLASAARRNEGTLRVFWTLLMLALIFEGAGQLAWAYEAWIKEAAVRNAGTADWFWSFELILLAAALIYLFRNAQGLLRGVRFMFDIVIVFIVMMTVSWEYLIKPQRIRQTAIGDWLTLWLDAVYPICGIVLIFFTLVLYSNVRNVRMASAVCLCSGGFVLVVGNILYLYQVDLLGKQQSPYLDLLWAAGALMFGLSGTHSFPVSGKPIGITEKHRVAGTVAVRFLLPYSMLAGLFFFITDRYGGWNSLFTGLSLSVLLILIRQVVIQLENDSLMERLHHSLKKSEYLAHHDDLTGLYNRRYFNARMTEALEEARRNGNRLGLLYMDLNRFKTVNDKYGHRTGDALIVMVASRLASLEDHRFVISRLGGDEFTVMVYPAGDDAELSETAENICSMLSEPYRLEPGEIRTSPSVGVAVYPEHAANDQELIGRADAAMYDAKESGIGWKFYGERVPAAAAAES
ncbi:DUF4084 domain-containing protein [Paenibacillus sp. DMB20]|uniref:DUF4084 domain-containing protein n=1 Tax=Paenibacillus sp. DMB20 TaxID=1642570 RepID=UPI00069A73FF|nr:DUF4084 domain-containing protein [Paenibacillus sp. DMB20]